MIKKISRLIMPVLLLSLMASCSSLSVPAGTERTRADVPSRVEPNKYEEVEMVTTKGEIHKGKIVSLEREAVEFSPFPYWNVDPVKLNLDEIHSIKLVKKESKAGRGFASGFGWTFVIIGTLAGSQSKYDEDYEAALLGSAILGGAGGLLGLVIGALSDASKKTKYEFFKMSYEEKERAVRKIMGR